MKIATKRGRLNFHFKIPKLGASPHRAMFVVLSQLVSCLLCSASCHLGFPHIVKVKLIDSKWAFCISQISLVSIGRKLQFLYNCGGTRLETSLERVGSTFTACLTLLHSI